MAPEKKDMTKNHVAGDCGFIPPGAQASQSALKAMAGIGVVARLFASIRPGRIGLPSR